jgi:hypothetical protein
MARGDFASSLLLLVFGLLVLFWVIPAQIAEPQFNVTMSPRLVPQICALAIVVLSVLLLVQAVLRIRKEQAPHATVWMSRGEFLAFAGVPLVILTAGIVFSFGFHVASGCVLIWGTLALMQVRAPGVYVLLPVLSLAASWLLLDVVLGVTLG